PVIAESESARSLANAVEQVLRMPLPRRDRPTNQPSPESIAAVADAVRAARKGVIVCGPAEIASGALAPHVAAVARATGFPVYAETTSQLRHAAAALPEALTLDALDVLLRSPSFRNSFSPDLVLQLGESPTSGAWERFVAERP